jgi:hypothetical protein
LVGEPGEAGDLPGYGRLQLVAPGDRRRGGGRWGADGGADGVPQGGVPVVAQGGGEPGHRGLADPGQVGEFATGQVAGGGPALQHALGDPALGRRETYPVEQRL